MINNPFVSKLNSFILGKADQSGTIAELNASGFDFLTRLDKLLENIIGNKPLPSLIILTGNAGDGKSHIIFKIWLYLTLLRHQTRSSINNFSLNMISEDKLLNALNAFQESFASFQSEKPIKVDNYFLVKDASAIEPEKLQQLFLQALSDLEGTTEDKAVSTTIISINEGILRAQLLQIRQEYHAFEHRVQEILKMLEISKEFFPDRGDAKVVLAPENSSAKSALILNLNTRDIGEELLESMLNELAQPRQFELESSPCGQCLANSYCPIRFNINILGKKEHPARKRLGTLFNALNQMGQHITFREVLSAIAQTLTGNLSCSDLQTAYAASEDPIQLSLEVIEPLQDITTATSASENSLFLGVLPFLFFNSIFVHSVRQKELLEPIQTIPLTSIGTRLSEEHLLLSIGRLDPAGYATPPYDVSVTFSSSPVNVDRSLDDAPYQDQVFSTSGEIGSLDRIVFDTFRNVGQLSSNKGIPDSGWLRSLVIASKRLQFFTSTEDKVALRHFPLQHYQDFQFLTVLLKKVQLNQIEKERVRDACGMIIAALNQFQQPRNVGTERGAPLELIQQDHFVLFSRLLASQFELIAAAPESSDYIEEIQVRLRFQHIKTKIFLDCDLLLYEILERFVDGYLSLNGLEPRITAIENFLTKLRSKSLKNDAEEYILVGRGITFSMHDGQITVQEK